MGRRRAWMLVRVRLQQLLFVGRLVRLSVCEWLKKVVEERESC